MADPDIRALFDPPYKLPLIESSGNISPAWQRWINEIYVRMGGKQALSNLQLREVITGVVDDASSIHDDIAGEIVAVLEKITPDDDDVLLIEDSADSNNKKKIRISSLPGGSAYEGDIDGGSPADVYLVSQVVDGGAP